MIQATITAAQIAITTTENTTRHFSFFSDSTGTP